MDNMYKLDYLSRNQIFAHDVRVLFNLISQNMTVHEIKTVINIMENGNLIVPIQNVQTSPNVPQTITKVIPHTMSQQMMSHMMSQSVPQTSSQLMPHTMSQMIPQTISQMIPQTVSQMMPQMASQMMPQTVSQRMPQTASQRMPQAVSQMMPPTVSQMVPQTVSQMMPHTTMSQIRPQTMRQSGPQTVTPSMLSNYQKLEFFRNKYGPDFLSKTSDYLKQKKKQESVLKRILDKDVDNNSNEVNESAKKKMKLVNQNEILNKIKIDLIQEQRMNYPERRFLTNQQILSNFVRKEDIIKRYQLAQINSDNDNQIVYLERREK